MADTIDIKPDTTYAVRLTRPVRAGGAPACPRSKITVKGRLLAQIAPNMEARLRKMSLHKRVITTPHRQYGAEQKRLGMRRWFP